LFEMMGRLVQEPGVENDLCVMVLEKALHGDLRAFEIIKKILEESGYGHYSDEVDELSAALMEVENKIDGLSQELKEVGNEIKLCESCVI